MKSLFVPLLATLPALSQNVKDWLQAIAWLAAAAGAIVAAFKFWSEFRLGRQQREQELRWKQAAAGKALNDEMLDDPFAGRALDMLDYTGTKFELPSKEDTIVDKSDIRSALDPRNEPREGKDLYILKCFDSLFYYMATMEHYTSSTLIRPEDIAFPLEYYVPLLAKFRDVVDPYLERNHLHRPQKFLDRYPSWKRAQ